MSLCGKDSRPVAFMSSGHNPEHTKFVNRKKADGSVINVQCPVCCRLQSVYGRGR